MHPGLIAGLELLLSFSCLIEPLVRGIAVVDIHHVIDERQQDAR